jgi:hypothetical protein
MASVPSGQHLITSGHLDLNWIVSFRFAVLQQIKRNVRGVGFPPDQSVRFTVKPDGKVRTYEVDLSHSPTYRGKIRRLRFDPVETGVAGDVIDVESISAKTNRP